MFMNIPKDSGNIHSDDYFWNNYTHVIGKGNKILVKNIVILK